MEKVKLTQKQENMLNNIISDAFLFNKEELGKALLYGYEVKPKFKVGDWVAYNYWGLVGKVICTDGGISLDNKIHGKLNPDDFKIATPEEIQQEKEHRWWRSHGRKVWEIKKGDLLKNKKTGQYFAVHKDDRFFTTFDVLRKPTKEKIRKTFRVVCFVEDRQDV